MVAKSHMLSVGTFAILPIALMSQYADLMNMSGIENDFLLGVFLFSLIFGSLLPDIDEPGSKIGRMAPSIIPHLIKAIFGHRGITHTVVFVLPFLVLYFYSEGIVRVVAFGISLGIISHILGDMLTKGGVNNLFYPFTKDITFGLMPKSIRFYTASKIEYFLVMPFFLIVGSIGVLLFSQVYQNKFYISKIIMKVIS